MRKVIQACLLFYCLVAGWGPFIGRDLSDPWVFPWATGYLVLVLLVAYKTIFSGRAVVPFPFVVLGILLLNFIVQMTGGVHSTLWPAYFIYAVMVAAFSPPRQAYAMVGILLAIEAANLVLPLPGGELAGRWHVYAGFGLALPAVSATASHIMQRTRREVQDSAVPTRRRPLPECQPCGFPCVSSCPLVSRWRRSPTRWCRLSTS